MKTKYSPYFLMFGREARYPIQVPEHYEVDGTVEDVVGMEVMAQNHNEQDQLFEQVREHIRKAQEKTRHPKTISGTTPTVHIGDLVLRQNIRSQQRKGGKLNPNVLGPYKIVAIEGKDENGALVPKINIDHLKLYKENKQRVPHRYENKKRSILLDDTVTIPTSLSTSSHCSSSHCSSRHSSSNHRFLSHCSTSCSSSKHRSLCHCSSSLISSSHCPLCHCSSRRSSSNHRSLSHCSTSRSSSKHRSHCHCSSSLSSPSHHPLSHCSFSHSSSSHGSPFPCS
nr:uncharacterized protein LOC125979843 [Syngnathus scovelli]